MIFACLLLAAALIEAGPDAVKEAVAKPGGVDWTTIILALIAGVPAAITAYWQGRKGREENKSTVKASTEAIATKLEAAKNEVAQKVDNNTEITVTKAEETQRNAAIAATSVATAVKSQAAEVKHAVAVEAAKVAETAAATNAVAVEAISGVKKTLDETSETLNGALEKKIAFARAEARAEGLIEGSKMREMVDAHGSRITAVEGDVAAIKNDVIETKTQVGYVLEILRRKDAPKNTVP